jgi:hypothetical protein
MFAQITQYGAQYEKYWKLSWELSRLVQEKAQLETENLWDDL